MQNPCNLLLLHYCGCNTCLSNLEGRLALDDCNCRTKCRWKANSVLRSGAVNMGWWAGVVDPWVPRANEGCAL